MAYAAMPDLRGNAGERATRALPRDARRELEFRRARRHSKTVVALKAGLPLAAVLILSLYALPSLLKKSIDNGRGTASVRSVTVEAGSLKMIEPHVKGVNERGEPYDIIANTATQASNNADVMYLEVVRGKLTGADGKISTLKAPDATHNNKAEEMIFDNGAVVTHDEGMSAVFKTATAYMKTQTLISKTPVVVRLHESTINAETMTLYWGERRAIFEGNVRTHIDRQQETAAPGEPSSQGPGTAGGNAAQAQKVLRANCMAGDTRPRKMERRGPDFRVLAVLAAALTLSFSVAWAQAPIGSFSGLSGPDSKKPIDIESDRLEVDDKNHTAVFIGSVSATQGENNLKAPRLEVFYENAGRQQTADKSAQTPKAAKPAKPAPAHAGAGASAAASADPLSSGQIKRIHAMGGKVVFMSTKDQQEATGDDANFDVKTQLITMTGKEVVLTQNKNKVKGTKLVIDLTTGKATVLNEEPGSGAAASGKTQRRIRAVFQQETGTDGKRLNPFGDTKPKGGTATQPAASSQKTAPPQEAAPSSAWQTQSR